MQLLSSSFRTRAYMPVLRAPTGSRACSRPPAARGRASHPSPLQVQRHRAPGDGRQATSVPSDPEDVKDDAFQWVAPDPEKQSCSSSRTQHLTGESEQHPRSPLDRQTHSSQPLWRPRQQPLKSHSLPRPLTLHLPVTETDQPGHCQTRECPWTLPTTITMSRPTASLPACRPQPSCVLPVPNTHPQCPRDHSTHTRGRTTTQHVTGCVRGRNVGVSSFRPSLQL